MSASAAPRRTILLVVVIAAVLAIGGGASVLLGSARQDAVVRADRQELEASGADLAAALATQLRRNADLAMSAAAYIAASEHVTNDEFAAWVDGAAGDRYPGLATAGYMERVAADRLDAFVAEQAADPSPLTPGPFVLTPPGPRPEYCLVRLGVRGSTPTDLAVPPGVDLCAVDPDLGEAARRAGNERRIAIVPILTSEAALGDLTDEAEVAVGSTFMLAAPVFGDDSPGTPPDGWVVVAFKGAEVAESVVGGRHDLGMVVRWEDDDVVVAQRRAPGDGPFVTTDHRFDADGTWTLSLTQPSSDAHAQAVGEGRAVTGFGILLTLLAAGLLATLVGARNHALRMVDNKTDELRHQALHDALTGLPNRALVLDRAEQLLARSRRTGAAPVAMFLDVDHFKTINDSLGHAAGDQLLRAVAERIRSVVREADTVGRLGGDEFVVLADGANLVGSPELLAQRLLDVMAEPFRLGEASELPLTVGISVGVVVGDRDDAGALLRDADIALYRAKSAGRGCFVVFDADMQRAVHEELELELDLYRAVDEGQLFLVYQPTFALDDGTVIGVEALLRWQHPTRGVIPPMAFVPVAEENGTIVRIGAWVLEEACRQGAEWHATGHLISVAVNVAVRQLESEDLVDTVRRVLDETGFPADSLVLEITESGLMSDAVVTAERLEVLKGLGVRIAVDDFGTGYSSLAYLQQFPVDTLKIDRTFVMRMNESPASHALVHTLVRLGKTLGMETFAEGIEDSEQLQHLRDEACDSGQGFLFARPLEPDAVTEFLAAHPVRQRSEPAAR